MYSASSQLSGQIVLNTYLEKYKTFVNVPLAYDQLLEKVTTGDRTKFLKILGSAFENSLNSDTDKLDSAMENLVKDTWAQIPTSDSFFQAMLGQIGGFSVYKDALLSSAADISTGLQAVGKSAINTGKILTYLMPILVIGGLIYVGKSYLDKARAT